MSKDLGGHLCDKDLRPRCRNDDEVVPDKLTDLEMPPETF